MSEQQAVRRVLDAWRRRGYQPNPALAVEVVLMAQMGAITEEAVTELVRERYPGTQETVISVAVEAMQGVDISSSDGRALRPIESIHSFARAATVDPVDVRHLLSAVARLEERVVKRFIVDILGKPTIPKDWGGEDDDIFSPHVVLDGSSVAGSFALKGRSVAGRLRPKDMGANGDQLIRLVRQPADLYVVQHVNEVDPMVRHHLETSVLAIRATRNPHAWGSVWDGEDCARLFVSEGYLDQADGSITPHGRTLLDDS